jgi:hypothetical protein
MKDAKLSAQLILAVQQVMDNKEDIKTCNDAVANLMKIAYDSLIAAGFSAKQATEIISVRGWDLGNFTNMK